MNRELIANPYLSKNPYPSPSQANWHRLYEVAPSLRRFYLDAWENFPAPKPLDRDVFISLCACLCDPQRREILRALLFELMHEDIIRLTEPEAGEGTA